jgi:Cu/Ag efflux pump CusA
MASFFTQVLRFRLLIAAAAIGMLALGIVQLRNSPVDVLPEFTPPYAEIQTEALGLSAEEVEQLITVPLEADLLNGVEGVEVIRSDSVPGLSSIVMVFAKGTDIYEARLLIQERLTQAHALPNVSRPPTLLPPLSSSNRVLMIGLTSTELSPIEQSVLARWTIRPQLMGVPGVANVSIWGLRDQQLQVQVDPARLAARRVTLNQIIRTTGNAQVVSPLSFLEASTPGTGGFIESPQQRLQVRHLLERIADPNELAKVPVEGTGGRVQLGDVSTIVVDHQPLIGDAVVNNGPGLLLVVEKFPGVSTPKVTEGVENALETLRPGLTGMSTDTSIFRPADYISDALDNIGLALLIGGILMLAALLALRLQWRAVVVAVLTVPLSIVTAALILRALGHEMNALVLAGLAAALTIVVDEAVTPADHALRRLREQQFEPEPESVPESVGQGWIATRRALVYATVIIGLAIVPAAVIDGRPGAFLAPLVTAYAVAVASAFVVAIVVAPALTVLLLRTAKPGGLGNGNALERVSRGYQSALAKFSGSIRPVILAAAACAVVAAVAVPFLNPSLIPSFRDRNVALQLEGPPGASREWMATQATELSRAVQNVPGVTAAAAHLGRAIGGDRIVNVNSADVWVSIDPDADYDETVSLLRESVRDLPGMTADVVSYTTQRMHGVGAVVQGGNPSTSGVNLLTGVDAPLTVRVYGEDPVILEQTASRIRDAVAGVDGVQGPELIKPTMQSTIEIEVDLEKAQAVGMTPGDVRRAEATLVQGIQVGSLFEDQKVFDVIVRGVPSTRRSISDIQNLLIDRPGGGTVRLGDVAEVRTAETPSVIRRDAVSRRMDIVAGIGNRPIADITADVQATLMAMNLPLEYHAEVLPQSTADEAGTGLVAGVGIAALLAAFLLFQAATNSWRLALALSLALPLSLVGGLVIGAITGYGLSLAALLGLLAAVAWLVRTSLVTIFRLAALDHEGTAQERSAYVVQRGGRERMVPILTSAVAILVLVAPFVVLGSRPGLEIVHPMAVVLIGALVTAVPFTLFALPTLYLYAGPRREPQQRPAGEAAALEPATLPANTGEQKRPGFNGKKG